MGGRSEPNVYHNGVREEDLTLILPSPSVRERDSDPLAEGATSLRDIPGRERVVYTSDLTGSLSALYQGPCSLHGRSAAAPVHSRSLKGDPDDCTPPERRPVARPDLHPDRGLIRRGPGRAPYAAADPGEGQAGHAERAGALAALAPARVRGQVQHPDGAGHVPALRGCAHGPGLR